MSERSVAREIQDLAALAQVAVEDIQQFVAGRTGAGAIEFAVPGDHCAVVVGIEDFNGDSALPSTTSRGVAGKTVTEVQAANWTIGADLFYVFPTGLVTITLNATPQGGLTYFSRAVGYFLPASAYAKLSRMGTKILS